MSEANTVLAKIALHMPPGPSPKVLYALENSGNERVTNHLRCQETQYASPDANLILLHRYHQIPRFTAVVVWARLLPAISK